MKIGIQNFVKQSPATSIPTCWFQIDKFYNVLSKLNIKSLIFQIRPLLTSSFHNVLYTGPFGTATIPKVFSNLLCAVHLCAASEALMVAKKAGLGKLN